jgi:SAM-dependent methyltransferase
MADVGHWEEKYRSGQTPWDTGRPSSELVRVVAEENLTPCRAVDLGCGTGANAVWLASQGYEVTGIDLSPLAVERARERARAANVNARFLQADVTQLPDLGGPFDFFFDRGCYHVVRREDVSGYLRALDRLTRPGAGGLVLTGNAREPHDPGPPVVDEATLRAELGQAFQIVWLREFRFDQSGADATRFLGWSCFLRKPAAHPG